MFWPMRMQVCERRRRMPRPRRLRTRASSSTGSTLPRSRNSGATAASFPRVSWISPRPPWRRTGNSPGSGGTWRTRAKDAGPWRRRSKQVCPPRCCARHCIRASSRAARPSSPTKSCPRCASGSEVTSRSLPEGARGTMERRDCDAVVLFGASGDLCYRKIYPALYQLVRRGLLGVPVIGVARQGWNAAQLAARVRESLKAFVPAADEAVVARLTGLLRYVDGDYNERATFNALRQALGNAQRPLHYLAIPASMFSVVIEHLR